MNCRSTLVICQKYLIVLFRETILIDDFVRHINACTELSAH